MKKQRGITLIALVVTIIVLIILAGISINLILGENGIITKASATKENTRGADVKETVAMRKMENVMIEHGTGTKYSKQDVIDELKEQGKLLDEEVELLKGTDIITIGDIEIDFSILDEDENTTGGSVVIPEITLTYDPPLNEYTNGSVVVTANTNATEYTIEMSTDGTNWEDVNTLTYEENAKVYARLTDGTTNIEGEVTNIDKTPPEVGSVRAYFEDGTNEEITFEEYGEGLYGASVDACDVRIELVNGTDAESGHKNTMYKAVLIDFHGNEEEYPNLTDSIWILDYEFKFSNETTTTVNNMISEKEEYKVIPLGIGVSNEYSFTITTEDNAGNISEVTYFINMRYR